MTRSCISVHGAATGFRCIWWTGSQEVRPRRGRRAERNGARISHAVCNRAGGASHLTVCLSGFWFPWCWRSCEDLVALSRQKLQLSFLFGDTPRVELLHSSAGKGGRLLLQLHEILSHRGDAPFDLSKTLRTVRHRSSPCEVFPAPLERFHAKWNRFALRKRVKTKNESPDSGRSEPDRL